jgi:uncharacterized damage-inducible protein DinB
MMPLDLVRELFVYNYWARDRQLEACAALTEEQFLQPLGNSFPSLRDTLAHLMGAEWIWLERWLGRSPQGLPPATDYRTLPALLEAWRPVEHGVREYLGGLTEEAYSSRLSFTNAKGETWTYPVWRSLLHVANHQTYHRGQVTMFLRQLGISPPALDVTAADRAGVDQFQRPVLPDRADFRGVRSRSRVRLSDCRRLPGLGALGAALVRTQ